MKLISTEQSVQGIRETYEVEVPQREVDGLTLPATTEFIHRFTPVAEVH